MLQMENGVKEYTDFFHVKGVIDYTYVINTCELLKIFH